MQPSLQAPVSVNVTLALPSSALCSITAVSRVPNSMEVWWVGTDASVRDAFWYAPSHPQHKRPRRPQDPGPKGTSPRPGDQRQNHAAKVWACIRQCWPPKRVCGCSIRSLARHLARDWPCLIASLCFPLCSETLVEARSERGWRDIAVAILAASACGYGQCGNSNHEGLHLAAVHLHQRKEAFWSAITAGRSTGRDRLWSGMG
jgi:hypothetical protein